MKRIAKIAVILMMTIAAVLTITACNNVTAVAIDESNLPRDTYVQGQELDLSQGALLVTRKDETETVSLDSEGVTVSGYDKDTLGTQTVTVEYGGQTATFDVTVYTRVTAENYTSDYLVGESFDTSKGRIRIVNDDGSYFTAQLSDSTVTLENFDSSSAATGRMVTVQYNSGSVSYTGQFPVNIYAIDETDFHGPSKRAYQSHETELDISGCYLALSGNGGKLTRYVGEDEITEEMISGFDPSAATEANRETPLVQTVTITYSGVSYEYQIQVTYSDVTQILHNVETLSAIDWSGSELPVVTQEQGELARETVDLYAGLDTEERTYISAEAVSDFVRTAAVYGLGQWAALVEEYENTFSVTGGTMMFTCTSYEAVKADYEKLAQEDNAFVALSEWLVSLRDEYATTVMQGETTLEDYLSDVYDPVNFSVVLDQIDYMLRLYATLEPVPADWTAEGLSAYDTAIESALEMITSGAYANNRTSAFRGMHSVVSSWRANDDFFEILYRYYYLTDNEEAIASLQNIYLPGSLQDLYVSLINAMTEISYMGSLARVDSTYFMYYYNNAREIAAAVSGGEDEMYADFYETLTFDGLLTIGGEAASVPFATVFRYLDTMKGTSGFGFPYGGYYYNSGAMLGEAQFKAIWSQYLAVMKHFIEDADYMKSQEYAQEIEGLFAAFVDLAPTTQYAFLKSMNVVYALGIPKYALDCSSAVYTIFAGWISTYYESVIPEASVTVFRNLLLALEDFARYRVSSGETATSAIDAFKEHLALAKTAYETLSAEDRATFDQYLGGFYSKYTEIGAKYVESGTVTDLGDWADDFKALGQAISQVNVAYVLINTYKLQTYAALISAFEEAKSISAYILENAPAEIVKAYYYEKYEVFKDTDWSMDSAFYYARNQYAAYMTGLSITKSSVTYTLWELYEGTALPEFMSKANYAIWAYVYGTYTSLFENVPEYNDAQKAIAMMNDFLQLSDDEKVLFSVIGGLEMYHGGLNEILSETMTASAAAALKLLTAAETAYVNYIKSPTGSNSSGASYEMLFKLAMDQMTAAYKALSGADLESFNAVASVYEYYAKAYEALNQPTED